MGSCVNTIIVLAIFVQVHGNLCPYDGDLTANDKPRITVFNQSLQEPTEYFSRSSEGIECLWTIKAKESDKLVRLKFDSFVMLRSSEYKDEDCVSIYDGDYSHSSLDRENLIQKLCEKMPEPVYNSSGRYLTVIFTQGGHGGWRWMTMNYTMVEQEVEDLSILWDYLQDALVWIVIAIVLYVFVRIFCHCRRTKPYSSWFNRQSDPQEPALSVVDGANSLLQRLGLRRGSSAQPELTHTYGHTEMTNIDTRGSLSDSSGTSDHFDVAGHLSTGEPSEEPVEASAPCIAIEMTKDDPINDRAPPPSYESLFK